MKKIKYNLELVFAIIAAIAVTLIIISLLNLPPDNNIDDDTYKIFFLGYAMYVLIPLLLLALIFSLISIIIAIVKLIRKKQKKRTITIVSLVLSALIFTCFSFIVISLVIFESRANNSIIPDDKYNTSDLVKVTENKTVYLIGYNEGKDLSGRMLYISSTPHENPEFSSWCEGDSSMFVYYQVKSDSLFVYVPLSSVVITYGEDTTFLNLIHLSDKGLDSLINSDDSKKIRKFEWK